MRGLIATILTVSLLALLPNAAADPGVTLPDADPVMAQAASAAGAQADATTTFTRTVFWESSQGVNEAQRLFVPTDNVVIILTAAGALGVSTVENGAGVASAVRTWGTQTFQAKVVEVEAILAALDGVTAAGVGAVETVAVATLKVLCAAPLDPAACEDGSLAAAVTAEVESLAGQLQDETGEERFGATHAAAVRLVQAIVPVPTP